MERAGNLMHALIRREIVTVNRNFNALNDLERESVNQWDF